MKTCKQCQKQVDETLEFCPHCGSSLEDEISHNKEKTKKPINKKVIVIVFAAVFVLVAAGVAIWYVMDQMYQKEHQEYPVELTFVAEGYAPESSSPIPVHVEGMDFEENAVSQDYLVGGKNNDSFSLKRGTYTVSVISTPITDDGTLYNIENACVEIEVVDPEENSNQNQQNESDPSDVAKEESAEGSSSESTSSSYEIVITPLDALHVTDEEIQSAYNALVAAGLNEEEAQQYKAAAIAKTEEAKAAERQRVKAQFENELVSLRDNYRAAASSFDTQLDMNIGAAEYYQQFDGLMNNVYEYLLEILPEEEKSSLIDAQEDWLNTRESEMYAAQSESFGGTMASMLRNDKGIEVTQIRITELINMIS